jgi:hypothetical protein
LLAPNKVCSATVSFSLTATGLVSDFMMINNNPATVRCE